MMAFIFDFAEDEFKENCRHHKWEMQLQAVIGPQRSANAFCLLSRGWREDLFVWPPNSPSATNPLGIQFYLVEWGRGEGKANWGMEMEAKDWWRG